MAITPLQSRIEELLANGSNAVKPQSRIEILLVELLQFIETGMASVFHYKGSVATYADLLLITGAEVGDVYNVESDSMNYAWDGTAWDTLGAILAIDSTITQNSQNPVTSAAIYSALASKVDAIVGKGLSTEDYTTAEKEKVAALGTAAAADTTTSIASGGTGLPTSGTIYTDQQRQESEIGAVANRGAKNLWKLTIPSNLPSGFTIAQDTDGGYVFNGTAGNSGLVCTTNVLFESGRSYILSGCPAGGSDDSYRLDILRGQNTNYCYGDPAVADSFTATEYPVRIRIAPNYQCNNLKFYPMLRYAEITDGTYVPYAKTNAELTAEVQDLNTNKIGMTEAFGQGSIIPDNTDLNTVRTIGRYRVQAKENANTMTNLPSGVESGFEMVVTLYNNRVKQELMTVNPSKSFVRLYNSSNSTWTAWNVYEGATAPVIPGLIELVDNGAKNLIVPYDTSNVTEGVTQTRSADGSLTFVCENVTSNKLIKIGDIDAPSGSQTYVLSGCTGGTMQTYQIGIYDGSTNKVYQYDDAVEYTGDVSSYVIRCRIVASEQTPFSGTFTVKPMLCTKAVWDISKKYVPYCQNLQAINTWVEYECLITDSSTVTNKFDVNNSYVKLRVNRALKRCVADISMTTIAAIDTSVTAFNIGTLSSISDKANMRPRVAPRAIVWAQTGGFAAVVAKTTTTDTISFFVADGTVTSGTTFTVQLSWDYM